RNPLLERASDDDTAPNSPTAPDGDAQGSDGGDDTGGEGGAAPEAGDFAGDSAPAPDWADEKLETSRSSMEQSLGTELENVFPDADDGGKAAAADAMPGAYSEWANTGSGGSADGDYNLESFVSEATTLADHLGQQMALAISDPAQRMIAQYLIDMVDEAGYLSGDLDAVADKLGATHKDVEAVLTVLQSFDPAGICASNLTECLALQLKERDRYDPCMQALVEHLDLLAKRDLGALRRICGV